MFAVTVEVELVVLVCVSVGLIGVSVGGLVGCRFVSDGLMTVGNCSRLLSLERLVPCACAQQTLATTSSSDEEVRMMMVQGQGPRRHISGCGA